MSCLRAVSCKDREQLKGHEEITIWFTGLSAPGKLTLAVATKQELYERGYHTYILYGYNIRHGLNKDLGFSPQDRAENIPKIAEVGRCRKRQFAKGTCARMDALSRSLWTAQWISARAGIPRGCTERRVKVSSSSSQASAPHMSRLRTLRPPAHGQVGRGRMRQSDTPLPGQRRSCGASKRCRSARIGTPHWTTRWKPRCQGKPLAFAADGPFQESQTTQVTGSLTQLLSHGHHDPLLPLAFPAGLSLPTLGVYRTRDEPPDSIIESGSQEPVLWLDSEPSLPTTPTANFFSIIIASLVGRRGFSHPQGNNPFKGNRIVHWGNVYTV